MQAPVRAVLERNEDMVNTGGRHPFKGIYKVNAFCIKSVTSFQYVLLLLLFRWVLLVKEG